jgi:hypothetical protein
MLLPLLCALLAALFITIAVSDGWWLVLANTIAAGAVGVTIFIFALRSL